MSMESEIEIKDELKLNNPIDDISNIMKVAKGTVKIELDNDKGVASGFFLKLERNNKEFYCLMTNAHVITKEMITNQEKIKIKYDNETKEINLELNEKERIIFCFMAFGIDITIIEIIPKDGIKDKTYFLNPNTENNYEEFIGKNTCDVNNKNYNYFIAEIYDSNVILNNSNNKTNIDLSECENILKKNYNIPENKSLTIFKIDYYFENTSIPKIEYKIFNNDQLLNLSYCENISLSISRPVNLEKLNIDISKFNETLDFPEIDIFDINSNFFNDICSMFTTSNKTDVPLNDRKNDYFQNVSLCDEGCIYDSFDKKTYKVNCICGNIQSIETKTKNNINNLFSDSNLKVLKCYSLYLKTKNYFKNF